MFRSLFQTVMGSGSSMSQQSAIDTIYLWHSKRAHERIFDSSHREISQYMQAVDIILQSAHIREYEELLAAAMTRLKREFQKVLNRHADHTAGPSSFIELSSVIDSTANAIRFESYVPSEAPTTQEIIYLRSIAERMSIGGNLGDCIKAYKSVRKPFLEHQLSRLHFEELKLSMGENTRRLMLNELKVKIELWNEASKICVQILFEREKKLCEEIFHNLGANAAADQCFVGTVQDFAVSLFGFAESVSLSNQPYDRMEVILGLYNEFLSVSAINNGLFLSESGKSIRNFCSETLSKIENDVERMLYEFENAVLGETSNVSDGNGAIQSSTEYVMKQIYHIVRNKNLLTNLIKSTPSLKFGDLIIPKEELGDFDFRTFLERHLILIIVVLKKNLEDKSKCCKDPILGHLFMMNSLHYIVQKTEGSNELHEMIGEFYLNELKQILKQAMTNYQTSTCNKFLTCFKDDGLYVTRCFSSKLSRTALKRRIKDFNNTFKAIQDSQKLWTVPDLALREEVRSSMSKILVPAYNTFLGKFRSKVEIKPQEKAIIMYSAKDLEALISEKLFSRTDQV